MAKTPSSPTHDSVAAHDYWHLSRQPLVSLVFVVPILVIYEAGVLVLGPKAVRNGVDVWLRGFLELLDFGNYFLLPVLVIGILLGWHHTTREPWRAPRGVFWGMAVECVGLAFCLRLISHVEAFALSALVGSVSGAAKATALAAGVSGKTAGLIAFLGAGVYEELLFRLILFCAAAWAIRHLGVAGATATAMAVLASSVVFAAAHYVGPYGEAIVWHESRFWYGAIFRLLAGVFFCVLFVARGFGIAAGAHAGYDILVKLPC